MSRCEPRERRIARRAGDSALAKSATSTRRGGAGARSAGPDGSSYGSVYFEPILETALALVLGAGEGAVLTGVLAYGLRSSLDRLFANGA